MKDDLNSDYLKTSFLDLLKGFKRKYKSNEHCRKALLKGRGWRETKGGLLMYTCPRCTNPTAKKRLRTYNRKTKDFLRPENEIVTRITYRCTNSKCRHEVRATTGTVFEDNEPTLWLWFLTLHTMALLGGKVPRSYIIREYYRYLVRTDQYSASVGDKQYRDKAYKNIGERVSRVVLRLSWIFEDGHQEELNTYLKYIAFDRGAKFDFIEWYIAKKNDKNGFLISWTPCHCPVDNEVANIIASIDHGREFVADVQYMKKMELGIKGRWVLAFVINGGLISMLRWLRVDAVNHVNLEVDLTSIEEEDHRNVIKDFKPKFQLVQVEASPNKLNSPFRLTYDFQPALEKAIESYGVEKFVQTSENNVINCPPEILHEVAFIMNRFFEANDEITGSWVDSV